MFHMFYDIEKARTEVSRTSFVYSLNPVLAQGFSLVHKICMLNLPLLKPDIYPKAVGP